MRMKTKLAAVIVVSMLISFAFAESSLKLGPVDMNVHGVSNDGIVSGSELWDSPYYLWNPDTDQVDAVGGMLYISRARFSADGNYLCGNGAKQIPPGTRWGREVMSDYNYIFTSICYAEERERVGYAAGQSSTYMGNGIILKTEDNGETWAPVWTDTQGRGIESMCFTNQYYGHVCGWNGYYAKTIDGGDNWLTQDPSNGEDVDHWTSVAFKDDSNGVIGGILNDGIAVYYTSNGGYDWNLATGLSAAPASIAYAGGDTYYLTTATGHIQKSTDNGHSWTTVYSVPMGVLLGMDFLNPDTGYVVGEGNIYHTTDGGATWQVQSVGPDVLWQDICYIDEQNIVLCGAPDMIYESHDGGNTWYWANESTSTFDPSLYQIAIFENNLFICGSGGTFYSRHPTVTEMGRYNVATEEWATLGSLGVDIEGNYSAGASISADGNTVVGFAWTDSGFLGVRAIAWNESDGFMVIGGDNDSSAAIDVSQDGSIIVGGQRYGDSFKSAVWRKNPAGGYHPPEYLLYNPQGDPNDPGNLLGSATAISANGEWIGGGGDSVTGGQPWIWSEATGCILLGNLGDSNYQGSVEGINHNGSIVIGNLRHAVNYDNETAYIWTATGGMQTLTNFATQTLGIDLGFIELKYAVAISFNGNYIAGMAYDPTDRDRSGDIPYRIQLGDNSTSDDAVTPATLNLSRIYPNPFSNDTRIEYKLNEASQVKLSIYNQRGQLVKQLVSEGKSAGTHTVSWDGRDAKGRKVSNGIYFARLNSGKDISQKKLILIAE